jgi:uncharacterized protein YdeI (YjbR/CyaY-like superfamily)
MKPAFFKTSSEFRKWLAKNHEIKKELLVGFYTVKSGKTCMTWPESVDQALCFGWIDGVRKNRDDESYTIRFTPRKAGSNWSQVNLKKMKELTDKGLMQPAGLAIFEKRKKEQRYAHEKKEVTLGIELARKFKSNKKAWDFFTAQAPSYQKVCAHWIMAAKQEATKDSRLMRVITASEAGKRLQ